MNHRMRHRLTTVLLLGLILSGPAALAAYLLKTAATVPDFRLVAAAPGTARGESALGQNPLVTGVLYSAGKATVDWAGTPIPLENSRYAYLGGETIRTDAGGLGILRLPGGNLVYVCPESQVRVRRDAGGRYTVDVLEGSSRYQFRPDTPFRVRANETVIAPSQTARAAARSGDDQFFVGEVEAHPDQGCIVCQLRNQMKLTNPDAAVAKQEDIADEGNVIVVAPDAKAQTAPLPADGSGAAPGDVVPVAAPAASEAPASDRLDTASVPIPAEVFARIPAGYPAGANQAAAAFLCNCEGLRELARRPAVQVAEAAPEPEATTAEPEAATAPPPPEPPVPPPTVVDVPPPPPELPVPPLAPPEITPIALAPPGPPEPRFDPELLPPTASGPPDSPIVVPPPLRPGSGGGGGAVISPS